MIRVSGKPKKNEALLAEKMLSPYFKGRGLKVILDLKELKGSEPITLLGVLSGIRREVSLLRGNLKLCSLNISFARYMQVNLIILALEYCNMAAQPLTES